MRLYVSIERVQTATVLSEHTSTVDEHHSLPQRVTAMITGTISLAAIYMYGTGSRSQGH